MIYRKTWFSYVLWVVYTMLCVIFLVFAGNYVCVSFFAEALAAVGDPGIMALSFLAVPLAAAVYWMLRGISGKLQKKYGGRERSCRFLEGIAVWASLSLGLFLRTDRVRECIFQLNAAASQDNVQAFVKGVDYFERAAVTAHGPAEPIVWGSGGAYVACLSFVLSFLGNKLASAILFQGFLQILGLVLVYAVTRRSAGRLPACVVLLYLACSPGYLEMLHILGPECLFFDLYLLVLLVMVSFVKGYCRNRFGKRAALAGAACTGILTGALGYLDLTAFTVLVMMTAIATGKKSRQEEQPVNHSKGISAAVAAVMLVFSVAGFLYLAAFYSVGRTGGMTAQLREWASLHVWNTRTFGFRPLYPYSLDMLFFGVLAAMAAFLVFEFFRSGREQNYMLWVLLCIVAAPTPLAVFGVQPFGLISMYIWGVLAGLGLQNCIFGGRTKLMKTMIEEINQAAEEAEAAEEAAQMQESRQAEETVQTQEPEQAEEAAQMQESRRAEKAEPAQRTVPQAEEPAALKVARKPRFIENPLPLPKKHVRRQMDYQYPVEEKDMKYDVEVSDEDDFDV